MLEDTPKTGFSDADSSILLKEGVGKALLASAEKERAMSIEIQQLKEANARLQAENDQLKREKEERDQLIMDLRRQVAFMQAVQQSNTNTINVTGNYINNQYNNPQK